MSRHRGSRGVTPGVLSGRASIFLLDVIKLWHWLIKIRQFVACVSFNLCCLDPSLFIWAALRSGLIRTEVSDISFNVFLFIYLSIPWILLSEIQRLVLLQRGESNCPFRKILEEIISADQSWGENLFRAGRQIAFMRILAAAAKNLFKSEQNQSVCKFCRWKKWNKASF